MSELKVYSVEGAALLEQHTEHARIAQRLAVAGIHFERWPIQTLPPEASQDQVLNAYQADVERLMVEHAFQAVDVVGLSPTHPDKLVMRQKFLQEHTHAEDEVRFFVEGQAQFYLHLGEQVYSVLCEQGDLISVPAGVRHWFDMGPNPQFRAIRLFGDAQGWVAHFTGSTLADQFPHLEN